jgi:hypothetical protein
MHYNWYDFRIMNLFTLFTLLFSLAPHASLAIGYDELNSSIISVSALEDEKLLVASPEDFQRAKVVVVINKATTGSTAQKMRVYMDGSLEHEWLVSTGREQMEKAKSGRVYRTTTPIGYYRPTVLEENHFSYTWKSNMPHSVFFIGGVAIHGTTLLEQLGKRASGGCVRLAPENAETLYNIIQSAGIKEVPTMDREGKIVLDQDGNPVMQLTWDTLIIVENHI